MGFESLLYGLTPRDDVSLLLEIRDWTINNFAIGTQVQREAFNSGNPIVPKGRIAMPIGAGFILQGAGGESTNIRTLTFDAERGSPHRGYFAGYDAGFAIGFSGLTIDFNLNISSNFIIRDDELVYANICLSNAPTVGLNGYAYLRVLYLPRGNIGV